MANKKKAVVADNAEHEESFEDLTVQSIKIMTNAMQTNSETVDMLTSKVTSLACHVAALEALLSEVIKITGVDLTRVNAQVRSRFKTVEGSHTDSNVVVDIAAGIACPAVKK
jgi:hypothetical protein